MKRGWFKESHRHSLAAKGVTTKRYMAVQRPNVVERYLEFKRLKRSPEVRQREARKIAAMAKERRDVAVPKPTLEEAQALIAGIQESRTRSRPTWQNWIEEAPDELVDGLNAYKEDLVKQNESPYTNEFKREQNAKELEVIRNAIEDIRDDRVEAKRGIGGFSDQEITKIREVIFSINKYGRFVPESERGLREQELEQFRDWKEMQSKQTTFVKPQDGSEPTYKILYSADSRRDREYPAMEKTTGSMFPRVMKQKVDPEIGGRPSDVRPDTQTIFYEPPKQVERPTATAQEQGGQTSISNFIRNTRNLPKGDQ